MDYSDLFNNLKREYPDIAEDEYKEILVQHTSIFSWKPVRKDNKIIEDTVSLRPIDPPTIPNQQNAPKIEQLPGKFIPMPPNQNNTK